MWEERFLLKWQICAHASHKSDQNLKSFVNFCVVNLHIVLGISDICIYALTTTHNIFTTAETIFYMNEENMLL